MSTREELVKALDDARCAYGAAYGDAVLAAEAAGAILDAAYIALKAYDEENT